MSEQTTRPDPVDAAVEAAVQAWPSDSMNVKDWHAADAALHRQDGWRSFQQRNEAVTAQGQRRVAEAALAAAVPLILDQLADEIDAKAADSRDDYTAGRAMGLMHAATLVRAARNRWTA